MEGSALNTHIGRLHLVYVTADYKAAPVVYAAPAEGGAPRADEHRFT